MGIRRHRPNVVVFFTDQQRWDSLGANGNPLDLTRTLDRMAQRGTHVLHAFTPQPVCAPARAVLQTGRYPTATGVYRNQIALPRDVPTLAHHFTAAGYATGYIGKWHLADRDPVPPEQRGGYQYWLAANTLEFHSDEPHHQNHRDDYPAPDGYAERYTGRWTPPDLATLGGSSQQHLGGIGASSSVWMRGSDASWTRSRASS